MASVGRRPHAAPSARTSCRAATRISSRPTWWCWSARNTAWCHPVLYQRLERARKERGTRLVVIDPRRTATCEAPTCTWRCGPAATSRCSTACWRISRDTGALDQRRSSRRIRPASMRRCARSRPSVGADSPMAARLADVAPAISPASSTGSPRPSAPSRSFSQGVNQSAAGTDKVNAIINCHLATGRIGQPGMGPFSLTGQPNAMGGREVGGLANQLAAHMEFDEPARSTASRRFWSAPNIARPARASRPSTCSTRCATAGSRRSGSWRPIPPVSMPDAGRVREALAACAFVVVSRLLRQTDTTRLRRCRAAGRSAWGEKDGTVTNSERRISRQRAVPPAARRGARRLVDRLRSRAPHGLGRGLRLRAAPAEIFREHARAVRLRERAAAALFDIGARDARRPDYDALAPVQWPVPPGEPPARRGCSPTAVRDARRQGALRAGCAARTAACDRRD